MKYWVLLWSALWRKPVRTVLALLSVTVAFTLFGTLHGVASAIDGVVERIAANRMRVQSLNGRGGALPMSYGNQIGQMPGVAKVTATVVVPGYFQDARNSFVAVAIGGTGFLHESRDIQITEHEAEAFSRTKTGAVAHRALADRFGWRLGDRVPFAGSVMKRDRSTLWEFEIVGIYDTHDPFLGDQLWFRYDYLDEGRAFGRGTAQSFAVITRNPKDNAAVADAIDQRFASSVSPTSTQSEREWVMAGMEQALL